MISPETLGLQRIRRRRLLMFGLFLSFLPTMGLLWYLTESDRVMFLSFWIWCAVYSASGLLVARSRCPRCGEYFHQGPYPWPHQRRFLGVIKPSLIRRLQIVTPFTRHCLNCGLGLKPRRD